MSQIKTYPAYDRRPVLRQERIITIVTVVLIIVGIAIGAYVDSLPLY